jgi:hypothetical protein
MNLMPDTALQILSRGGGLRIPVTGLTPETMQRYAATARTGKARLEFVVGDDAVLTPDTMSTVAAAGGGMVLFDCT